uniref:G_PROTEIN_RECEP_F1_2 domain-containing protein n=1 Tax=Ascaris lumbricoides TaxID=6252 RepID=A0A0M3I556_ASCLU
MSSVAHFTTRQWPEFRFFSRKVESCNRSSVVSRSLAYIVLLAAADLLVLLTAPLSFVFVLDVQWQFGSFICRLHSTIDISGKLFSVVTLTCISLERYFSVKPNRHSTRKYWCMRTIPLSFGVMVCIAVPVIPWAMYTDSYDIDSGRNITTTMCINTMPDGIFALFVGYLVTCGFICPLFVMSACYYLLVRLVKKRLRERLVSGAMARQPKYICKLTKSIWRVSAFHFICWTPFWFFTVAPTFVIVFELNMDLEGDNW